MNISAENLLARFARDYPSQYELTRLRVIVDVQQEEIDRLQAQLDQLQPAASASPAHAADEDPAEPAPQYDTAYDTGVDTDPLPVRLRSGSE
ncbi:MAG: hypothetical protein ABWY93_02890 [Mycobacterium sp.]